MDRDFKGIWIPAAVWLDVELNALDKIILMEIDSLDRDGCFASNKYIADFCQCSETKVSTAISKLINKGYIVVDKFDGRQRILKSRLSKFERQTFKNCKADSQNLKVSNNSLLNESNNTPLESPQGEPQKRFKKPTVEEVREYCISRGNSVDAQRFVDYYESNGWKVGGRGKMADWRAAVRTWERGDKKKPKQQSFEEMFSDYTGNS